MKNNNVDFIFKIIIIGESGVGKTCLLVRYVEEDFVENHLVTIGVDFKLKYLDIEDKAVKLQIWDTAGQERFRTLTKTYYKDVDGIILTYDLTNETSFKNIRNWIKQIEQNTKGNVCKILIGNKCDLKAERQVSFNDGKKLATEFGMLFYETSAKTNENVTNVFKTLVQEIMKDEGKTKKKPKIVFDLTEKKDNDFKKKNCC